MQNNPLPREGVPRCLLQHHHRRALLQAEVGHIRAHSRGRDNATLHTCLIYARLTVATTSLYVTLLAVIIFRNINFVVLLSLWSCVCVCVRITGFERYSPHLETHACLGEAT
jgi:hypothetical protein